MALISLQKFHSVHHSVWMSLCNNKLPCGNKIMEKTNWMRECVCRQENKATTKKNWGCFIHVDCVHCFGCKKIYYKRALVAGVHSFQSSTGWSIISLHTAEQWNIGAIQVCHAFALASIRSRSRTIWINLIFSCAHQHRVRRTCTATGSSKSI